MNKRRLPFLYSLFDVLAAIATWVLFFIYRKYNVDHTLFSHFAESIFDDPKFYMGIIFLPIYWLLLHTFVGYYKHVYRKSRLKELGTTLTITAIGVLLFFFVFILDDIVNCYVDYIKYFFFLFSAQFLLTYIPRLIITTSIIKKIQKGIIGFNTLIIGSDAVAMNTFHSVLAQHSYAGNYIIGYVSVPEEEDHTLAQELPCLGTLDNLQDIINEKNIEELIIAIHNGKRKYVETIITMTRGMNVNLKLIPQQQDYLLGVVKTSAVQHVPLISINPEYLPEWQKYIKRGMDILLSVIAMILLLPIYIFLAIGVKLSSKGPIFYKQERIGYRGKPFMIYKFRSMVVNAEADGPQLSSKTDERITSFGKFMRKSRLDETPQFFNVLIGDMSLVGPRPERQYYIDKIIEKAPYYKLLLNVKPGITSWGQVKFGYAENIDEMIERLRWDILYIENMSLQMDLKILIYTALIVLKRSGK